MFSSPNESNKGTKEPIAKQRGRMRIKVGVTVMTLVIIIVILGTRSHSSSNKKPETLQTKQFVENSENRNETKVLEDILFGENAALGQFPFYVAFAVVGGHPGIMCSGVLVRHSEQSADEITHAQYVLTAAHCLGDCVPDRDSPTGEKFVPHPNPAVYQIYARTVDIHARTWVKSSASGWKIFNGMYDCVHDDIAVIKLTEPFRIGTNVKTATLSSSTSPPGTGAELDIMGFGKTSAGGKPSTKLQWATVERVSNKECAALWGNTLRWPTNFCAGHLKQRTPATGCKGDSGGPAVKHGTDVVVGIQSMSLTRRGDPSCLMKPSLYMNVGHYRSFVDCAIASPWLWIDGRKN